MRRADGVVPIIVVPLCCCVALACLMVVSAGRLRASAAASSATDTGHAQVAPEQLSTDDQRDVTALHSAAPPRAPPRAPRIEPCSLPLLLRGTLWSANPAHSLAAVEDERHGRVRSLRVGDVVEDAKVLSIHRGRLLLSRGDRIEELKVGSARTAMSAPPRARPTSTTSARQTALAIHQDGPNAYRVSRPELERFVREEGESALRDVRVMPAFDNGRSIGFRLAFVRPGSLMTKLGLRQGDVVRGINGRVPDSPEKALEIYTELQNTARVDVEVDRSGATTRLSYRLDGTGNGSAR